MARPFGWSARKLLLFVASVLVTVFGLLSQPVAAQAQEAPPCDIATWQETKIVCDGNTYTRSTDGEADDPRGVTEGAMVFTYRDIATVPNTLHYIYFAANVDENTADQALYSKAQIEGDGTYTNISERISIAIEPYRDPAATTTSCNQEGIGWIICPVSRWLAEGMDNIYKVISGYMEVQPLQTNTDNPMHRAWSVMRNFANVLFVIGFLVIIYSQITSVGLSNYEIKKMLPRLVITAILVNISYWICALAIDASNIAGHAIHDLFITLRQDIVGPEGNSWDLYNWQSLVDVILGGAAVAGGAAFGIYSLAASGGGVMFMVLPLLLGLGLAVLVALLILAARQAIITILLVISPLAFAAFLLPNTEKYFEKWRSIGATMLLLFPIFSVLFGGAQLAGMLIIQNASHLNIVILGMAVQVAPLVITPLLIRFSGSLLGRIAGMVNNPNKGLIDRTRKWAGERADQHKDKQIAKGQGFLANRARNIDSRRRKREGWQKAHQSMAEANWNNTSAASDIQQYAMRAADIKELGDSNAQARYNASKATNSAMQNLDINARAAKLNVDLTKAKIDANWEEAMAGRGDNLISPEGLSVNAIHNMALQSHVEARRAESAKDIHKDSIASALLKEESLRTRAGGIAGHQGAESALAAAVTAKRQSYADSVKEATQIIKHFNLSGEQRQDLVMGKTFTMQDESGNIKTFDAQHTYAREAAIDMQMSGEGKHEQIEEIIAHSGGILRNFRTTIGSAIADNKLSSKAVYLGGQTINDTKQGIIRTPEDLNEAVAKTVFKGKIEPSHVATNDVDAIRRMVNVVQRIENGEDFGLDRNVLDAQVAALKESIKAAATLPSLKGNIAANVWPELEKLVPNLRSQGAGQKPGGGNQNRRGNWPTISGPTP